LSILNPGEKASSDRTAPPVRWAAKVTAHDAPASAKKGAFSQSKRQTDKGFVAADVRRL
jgi:hypothetical protein